MAVSANQIQQLYIAYYGRPADPLGLAYWQAQAAASTTSGMTDAAILSAFGASFGSNAEYTATFTGLTDGQKVNLVYNNLFSHSPDLDGLVYWTTKLTNGSISVANMVLEIRASAVAAANTDGTAFTSKVTAAESFTASLTTTALVLGYAGGTAGAVRTLCAPRGPSAALAQTADEISRQQALQAPHPARICR